MSIFDQRNIMQMGKLPIYLDDDKEMQVGVIIINPEFVRDFDACPPIRTHRESCKQHGQHATHYSIPSLPKKDIKIDITVRQT